jgi:hypothetical protein
VAVDYHLVLVVMRFLQYQVVHEVQQIVVVAEQDQQVKWDNHMMLVNVVQTVEAELFTFVIATTR